MLPVRIHAVWFSATGTTKKTVTRIARRLADALGAVYEEYDYTLPAARQQVLTIPAGELAVVGCPTYAGRVPNLLICSAAAARWLCRWCCSATAITMMR